MRTLRTSVLLASVFFVASCQTGGLGRSDLDGDGFLTYDEFAAAAVGQSSRDPGAAFIAADSDRDGTLSAGEFQVYTSTYAGR